MKRKTPFRPAFIPYFLLPLSFGAWGCLLLRLHLSGQLVQIQNPSFHGLTLFFALVLLLTAVFFPFFFDPSTESPGLSLPSLSGKMFLLLLPVAAYLSLPDEVITTDFLRQRSSSNLLSPGALKRFLPGKPGELHRLLIEQIETSTPDEPLPLDLLELVYLSQDRKLRTLYDGQCVILLGQWLGEDAEHFKIAKLLIFCCAADGRTISLRVNGNTGLTRDGTWIEVTGTLRFRPETPAPELDLHDYTEPEGFPDFQMQ